MCPVALIRFRFIWGGRDTFCDSNSGRILRYHVALEIQNNISEKPLLRGWTIKKKNKRMFRVAMKKFDNKEVNFLILIEFGFFSFCFRFVLPVCPVSVLSVCSVCLFCFGFTCFIIYLLFNLVSYFSHFGVWLNFMFCAFIYLFCNLVNLVSLRVVRRYLSPSVRITFVWHNFQCLY